MHTKEWELACPGCGNGFVRVVQRPSRAEVDAMLPDSMRAPPIGAADAKPRFDGKRGCSECGFDAATLADAIEADGLPDDAREVTGSL